MARLFPIAVAVLALGAPWSAMARSGITSGGTTEISEAAGIQTAGEVIFQNIDVTAAIGVAAMTASVSSANITVMGMSGDAVSLAVPQTFSVVSPTSGQSVMVVTSSDGKYASISGLQSLISPGGMLSVDIGGALQIDANQLQPGEYQGLLVVIAQYN